MQVILWLCHTCGYDYTAQIDTEPTCPNCSTQLKAVPGSAEEETE